MKEINIQKILYDGFKKYKGQIIKSENYNNYWVVKDVYFDKEGNAKIKFYLWDLLQKKWVYNSTNFIQNLNTKWKPKIITKKQFRKMLILDELK